MADSANGLLTARAYGVADVSNGNVYMIGGDSGAGYHSTVEKGIPRPYFSVIGPACVTAGSDATFTVTALMPDNTVDTSYAGTIHFTSSDSQAVLPADATLVDGTGTFTVIFGTAGSQMVTATDTVLSSITGTSGITGGDPIAVSPAAATHLGVNVWSNPIANSTFSFTVTALDQFNNTDTNYVGTVHFSSSDSPGRAPGRRYACQRCWHF